MNNGYVIIKNQILSDTADVIRSYYYSRVSHMPKWTPEGMAAIILVDDPSPTAIVSFARNGLYFGNGYGGVALNQGLSLLNKYVSNTAVMYPLIGADVTNCMRAFFNCRNLVGKPTMRSNIVDSMSETYAECWNLTGEPETQNNVKTMHHAYFNCYNITGNAAPYSFSCTTLTETYRNCRSLNGVSGVYPAATMMYGTYMDTWNLTGDAYIGDKVTNCRQCYQNSGINGNPAFGLSVTDGYQTYWNCVNLRGDAVCAPKMTSMENLYFNCVSLDGNACCGENITTMLGAYTNCHVLKNPTCGDKVTTMERAYQDCWNMTGAPFIGNAVTGIREAYMNCYDLTGQPTSNNELGFIVSQARNAFRNCQKMTGTGYFNRGDCYEFQNAFRDCTNFQGLYIRSDSNAALMTAATLDNMVSSGVTRDKRLNIVFKSHQYFNNFRGAATYVNNVKLTWSNIEVVNLTAGDKQFEVKLPYTYTNGKVYGNKIMLCNRRSYNQEYNIYAYGVL